MPACSVQDALPCPARQGVWLVPLQRHPVQASVGKVAASLEAELGTLNEGLQRRQLIAATRSLLELMQDTAHVLTKVHCCQMQPCRVLRAWSAALSHYQLAKAAHVLNAEGVRHAQLSSSLPS